MSAQELKEEAMILPLAERVLLAQALWESIGEGLTDTNAGEAVQEAILRDQELSSGEVQGRSHDDVMRAARRAIGCE